MPGSIATKHDSLGFTKDSMSYEYIYILAFYVEIAIDSHRSCKNSIVPLYSPLSFLQDNIF